MIYDISQPLFECNVFPGDDRPKREIVRSINNGDLYNLTNLEMCVHNGTHVDSPMHFIKDGKGIDEISLNKFVGLAYVVSHNGNVTKEDALAIMLKAKSLGADKKILIKGKATITLDAAKVFAEANIDLIGNESQTVGPEDAPMAVHLVLLGKEVVLLEGIKLTHIPDGVYTLNCAPLNLSHCDGSPCRAILID